MRTHIHGGRRRRSPEIPWLLIATAIGIIVVVVAALFFFTGTGGSSTGYATSSDMVVVPATTSVPAQSGSSAAASPSPAIVVAIATPATIPGTGVYVSVNYLGGFNGTYSSGGVTTNVPGGSGARQYQVANATGTVTAVFQKTDSTATHALTVIIYENGRQLATESTSAAYGKVTVTANL